MAKSKKPTTKERELLNSAIQLLATVDNKYFLKWQLEDALANLRCAVDLYSK